MESSLLSSRRSDELNRTARTAVGDSLRSITYFTRDSFDQLYLREDLEQDADLTEFVGHEWHGFETTQNVYGSSELGEYEYTLRSFENGYLLRVTTDNRGVFITTDGITLRDFNETATAILELFEEWNTS